MGVLVILIVVMFIFIQHYMDPNSLRTAPQFDGKNQQSLTYRIYFVPLYPISVINIIYEWVCLWKWVLHSIYLADAFPKKHNKCV